MGFSIAAQTIEHWQLWNNLPTATSSVLLHEIHSGSHLQHVNHPPVGAQSEMSRRNLSPSVMKARTLASGAPSETTYSLQFPTHTFNLLALMQMLLRAEKAAVLSLCELTCFYKQNRNFIRLLFMPALCSEWSRNKKVVTLHFPVDYTLGNKNTSTSALHGGITQYQRTLFKLPHHPMIMQPTIDLWRGLICLFGH